MNLGLHWYPPLNIKTFLVLSAVMLGISGRPMASDIDVYAALSGPESVRPGSDAAIQIQYGNFGPEASFSSVLDILLPAGVPAAWEEITQAQMDALLSSCQDDGGNQATLRVDETCSSLVLELRGPDTGWGESGLLDFEAGAARNFSFELAVPGRLSAGIVRMTAPPELAGDLIFGTGTCDESCQDCIGPRLDSFPAEEYEWELVSDNTGNPHDGCDPFVDFHPGDVAVVEDSGNCNIGVVAYHARYAQAPVIVVLSLDEDHPDAVYNKGSSVWNAADPPFVVLSYNEGQAIENDYLGGKTVRGLIGRGSPSMLRIDSSISARNGGEFDSFPDNNDDQVRIALELLVFRDGFESGDSAHWSFTSGGIK